MSTPVDRTVVVLLASGLSRRYGRRNKLMEKLAGKPLVDHAAAVVSGLDALARVAVCPADRPEISTRLEGQFIIALNDEPARGLGHSIAVGAKVALQFRPDAILLCMADMPFMEADHLNSLLEQLGGDRGFDIVHSGGAHGARPPAAFDAVCFDELEGLDGDDGARQLMSDSRRSILGTAAAAPLLRDVDTRDDLDLAARQYAIRAKHAKAGA